MRSVARLSAERSAGTDATIMRRQRSHGALVLRPTIDPPPAWAHVWGLTSRNTASVRQVAGAAGPVGGDYWRLEIDVGAGAALILSAVAGTVALPGPRDEPSVSDVKIRVGAGGTLIWEPGVQIAAAGCRHQTFNDIQLERDARLFVREEAVLGRYGEQPGEFRQRLRVTYDGAPVYDQELHVGDDSPGWNGPAVMGGRRALGSVLVVDPDRAETAPFGANGAGDAGDTAVMPLGPHAVLITSVDHDSVTLGENLQTAFLASISTHIPSHRDAADASEARAYAVK